MGVKIRFLHIPNCSPEEVAALRGLVGRRLAITESHGRVGDAPADSAPVVRSMDALPANPEHGEGVLVVVELWEDSAK